MNVTKVFIDFADFVSIGLNHGRKLCYFNTFDYSETILDKIYAVLSDVKVTSAAVVLHGKVGGAEGSTLSLEGAGVFEQAADVQAIDHLLKAAGIPEIEYYEFAGYYLSQGKQNVIFADQESSVVNLIVYKDSIISTQLCTDALLQQTASSLYNRYELSEIIDVKNLVVPAFLDYFDNLDTIVADEVFPVLSLFAFTQTTLADSYKIDKGRLESLPPAEEAYNRADVPGQEVQEESAENCKVKQKQEDRSRKEVNETEPARPQKNKRFLKFLAGVLMFLLVLALVAAIAGDAMMKRVVSQRQNSLADLSVMYQANQDTVSAYQRIEQVSDKDAACVSGVELAGKLDLSKSSDNYVHVTNSGMGYVGYFKTEGDAKAFLGNVKKIATVTSSRIAKSKKGTYQCKLEATVA